MSPPNTTHARSACHPRDRSVRLAASVAHEVRSALASILYSADFLEAEGGTASMQVWRETLSEIGEATRRLQLMSDSLLDHAGLGPAISVPVSVRALLARAQALLQAFHRGGTHTLHVELPASDVWVRGNPLVIEQALVHAVLSVAACKPGVVFARAAAVEGASFGLWIGGHGSGSELQRWADSPAFAEAASLTASQGGQLRIVADPRAPRDALFWLELLRSEGPR
jgi:phosphoglycerate-specific signal transduction histidine kinase